ncbi:MAG: carboxypeptidase regulatory-like domain-containing protein [Acidobacteria bacterium]|nr:carboxypeptidase regulatory-like domain-containing protein [Acidobacteriota bacterium]
MSRVRLTVLLCALVLMCSVPARAADCTWSGTGLWTDVARWSCGVVPDGDDHAILTSGSVTVAASQAVGNLTLGSGGDLVTSSGTLTVSGTFTWTGGFLRGTAPHAVVLAASATGTRTGGTLSTGGRLVNQGTFTHAVPSGVGGGGVYENQATGTFILTSGFNGEPILNTGIVRKTTADEMIAQGRIETTAPGQLQVQAGTLRLQGGTSILGGATTISPGATLRITNNTTHPAGASIAGAGVLDVGGGLLTVLAAYAHAGETRVSGGQADFDNAASVTFAALTHTSGFLDIRRPSATITGAFTRSGGTLRLNGSTITFAGTGIQPVVFNATTAFVNVAVAASTVLTDINSTTNPTVSGTLTNLGIIRAIRTMTTGARMFGLTGTTLNVATLGALTSVQIDRRDVTHPQAGPGQVPGRFWTMTPTGAGYVLSVTLPHAVADHATTSACRFTGSTWDCARTSSAPGLVTRANVTTLSDWAVGVGAVESYSITGTIRLGGTTPMSGVTVQRTGASTGTTTTSGTGTYAFSSLGTGTYTVTPTLAGHGFTPETRTFTNITADQVGDFTGFKTWRITGTVRDRNDTGVPGITITATGTTTRAVTTDADGAYVLHLPAGGTYTITPSRLSFEFAPESETFTNLSSDQVASFFLAEVGTFTRYFAEGATSDFFDTEIALLNATGESTTARLAFLKGDGTTVTHDVALGGLARATVFPKQLPGMGNAEFSTVITSTQPLIADRTMRWDARGYGSHAETSIAAPALEWYLAEGATIGGFQLFYLIQNPGSADAQIEVTYLLPAPQAPLVRTHTVTASSRFNIWVNLEDPVLGAAEVSAVIRSTNDVPVIVERAMYLTRQGRGFDAGHESAGITTPAAEWFLAEGATGPYFDLFILIANPGTTAAPVSVDYLLPGGATLTRDYAVAPQSRFNIWVDHEDAQLADTAVSARVRSTNGMPIIVERAMWWPGGGSTWHEGHNSAGADRTSTKWGLADGEVGGPFNVQTYILIANTSDSGGTARVTLVFEDGATVTRDFPLVGSSRESVPVSVYFPEAAGRRFGAVVEAFGSPAPQIVVERAMYGDALGVRWAAGSNVVGTRLR